MIVISWEQSPSQSARKGTGLLFVENPSKATDQQGRRIIPAQDFVSGCGMRSSFGIGTAYPSGQLVVIVLFTRNPLGRAAAERMLPLTDWFRDGTPRLASGGRIFAKT